MLRLIESNKNLINEHVNQQMEQVKAIQKALIAKETAEWEKSMEEIMTVISNRVDQNEKMLWNKMQEESEWNLQMLKA